VSRAPTKYGWAHADDETACMEPAWCARAHVPTPVVERVEAEIERLRAENRELRAALERYRERMP
jgi:hypothetical protein